ncbi:MAG: sulfite exporter TauE/SafE family protein [archaeon]|nr:sulfite exporter TauE/SafE family protein [archaeon]MCR4323739.1 sulfite exporter TauE/SafE family protein [Nanoarchaeota archaeon]
MVKKTLDVDGMTCNSCTRVIEMSLKGRTNSVSASYQKGEVEVDYDIEKISQEEIEEIIEKEGYSVRRDKETKEEKVNSIDKIGYYVMAASLIALAYFLYKWIINLNLTIPGVGEQTSLVLLFLVGLLTGFHCVSMCGGFIISYMTRNAKNGHVNFSQHLVYGGAKTVSYIIIGGLFGLIGGIVSFSVGLRAGVAIFAGLFMVAYALSMMGLKFFRKFQFNPKFLSRWSAKASMDSKGPYKAPLITGLLGGLFIACGPLQAMYLYAAGTGSPVSGALSLAAFGLGTLPVLLGFAGFATAISKETMKKFLKISAVIVLILGLIMLNRGLTVLGSPLTFDAITSTIAGGVEKDTTINAATMVGNYQVIKMEVYRSGWSPDIFTLRKGIPVRWEIDVKELTNCNNEIIVREYNLDIKLNKGMNIVEFTPTEAGTVRWSCWMGMIPGVFVVTEDGSVTESQLTEAASATTGGGTCGMGGGCGCGG